MGDSQYMQDSLALRIDGDRIPSVIPPVDTRPKRRVSFQRLRDARSHGIPEIKRCRTCNVVKQSSEFSVNKNSRDGLNFRCSDCNRKVRKERYSTYTPDELRRHQEKHLKRTYGLTLEERDAMLSEQGGCAICGSSDHGAKNWHVDHDHETGEVRGILCQGCNHALGGAHDNPDTLIAAAKYLWKRGK